MNNETPVAVLCNYHFYGLKQPVIGFSMPSVRFNPRLRILYFGRGEWKEVATADLVEVSLSEDQKKRIFSHY